MTRIHPHPNHLPPLEVSLIGEGECESGVIDAGVRSKAAW